MIIYKETNIYNLFKLHKKVNGEYYGFSKNAIRILDWYITVKSYDIR